MPRAKSVRATQEEDIVFDYPDISEYNEPPQSFDDYMKIIYGPKGIGKTTLAASFPNYLTFMLEPKRRGLRIRQLSLQKYTAKQIREGAQDTWKAIINTTAKIIDDPNVPGVNYDSIDILYECCGHSVCASHGINSPQEAGRGSADVWNEMRDEFATYFDTIRDTDLQVNMLSHVKEREEATLDGGKMGFVQPSCSPACLKYIRQAVDIALCYGWYNGTRAMMVRDETNSAFVANGVQGKFLQPDGKRVSIFEVPDIADDDDPSALYNCIKDAFNNKAWDIDTPESEREVAKPKPVKKKPVKKRPR